ncbi:AMP-binding protein [Falsigemmobacter faecalis]|uniref:Acid-CoA ligase n=1 Tax=Falsigemmobacter faecalis TaxID=2488730 RepID=A0A3P3D9F1_9RHOB|nr:AMP-binding protein [Falsigemmobacter faecalis]RRH69008.1 acid-CoA ligase [Falsigemmobacter faecalis]
MTTDETRSYGQRLSEHARLTPRKTALSYYDRTGHVCRLTWAELDAQVNRAARALLSVGATQGDVIGFALKNSPLHIILTLAIWRIGATTFNFDPALPQATAMALLSRSAARLCISETDTGITRPRFEAMMADAGDAPVENRISHPGKILSSGGSTGLPKLMADDQPYLRRPGASWGRVAPALGFFPGQTQLMAASLSHNAGLTWAQNGLFEGQHLVLFEKFNAPMVLQAIATEQVHFILCVTTMVVRLLDAYRAAPSDLSSLVSFYHTAGPCPAWLKQEWIEILGAERVFEMYGSGENTGQTVISGPEWLTHRGSVGRGFETDILICDAALQSLPPGTAGEVFMLPDDINGRSAYIGAEAPAPRKLPSGHQSVGDTGWLDADGYLYLTGRLDDVINCGGLKIHPETIEAAALRLPGVLDAVSYGLPDRDWGEIPVAELVLRRDTDLEVLRHALLNVLGPQGVPRRLIARDSLPRDDFGKIRRKAIRAAAIEALVA